MGSAFLLFSVALKKSKKAKPPCDCLCLRRFEAYVAEWLSGYVASCLFFFFLDKEDADN